MFPIMHCSLPIHLERLHQNCRYTNSNATYTHTIEAASGKKAEFTITQKMIHAAMDETAMDSNESDEGNQ